MVGTCLGLHRPGELTGDGRTVRRAGVPHSNGFIGLHMQDTQDAGFQENTKSVVGCDAKRKRDGDDGEVDRRQKKFERNEELLWSVLVERLNLVDVECTKDDGWNDEEEKLFSDCLAG